ncbi:hypothetical protein IFM89_012838 [Coptis chinensis]|uniref:Uncharacterized protein n=1 Tax=Coptis chinensis TaxID=261450 RepID=A0A835IV40_9MAGN|nr:hypothetical protein IFM89_012838 [Coptis chinensis]
MSAKVRQQATNRSYVEDSSCLEAVSTVKRNNSWVVVLFEHLGIEYQELAHILKNRHKRVEGICVELDGRIADRRAEFVPARQ